MTHVDRRQFLGWSALAAAGFYADGLVSPAWAQDVRGLPMTSAVQTASGRVRGVVRYGVNQFWGVPYAASTAGANRFMSPAKAASWSGVRDCFQVGNRSPQDPDGPISEVFALDRQEPMGEDCLNLNVFTPALGSGNRPVMVWLHGGGFSGGSGNWLLYEGTNLARKEDVVMVSVTHRLNLFGFLYLADLGGGEKWANVSNAGMQDIVAALAWIKENIAAFGGNPNNVTVFGQSGGGSKVTTLMAMPSAKGLFHRAIAMSGAQVRGATRENATRAAEQFLGKLALKPNQLDRLETFTWKQLQDAYYAEPRIQGLATGPVVDGRTLPRDQWYPDAPAVSADVPLMMGSTETEDAWNDPPPPLQMPEDEMLTRVKRIVRNDEAKARDMVALYRKTHPGISNTDVWLIMNADNTRRANAQLLNAIVSVLLLVAVAGPQRADEVVPHARHSVCAVQHRSGRVDDRRHAGPLRARTQDEHGICVVRPHRESKSRRPAELAGVQHACVSDDGVRERVQAAERSEPRGASRAESDSRAGEYDDNRAVAARSSYRASQLEQIPQLPTQPPPVPHRGGCEQRRHNKQEHEHCRPHQEFANARLSSIEVEPHQVERQDHDIQDRLNRDRLQIPPAAQNRDVHERRSRRGDRVPRAAAQQR
jgi:para-nitrobenzyl esterase